MPERVTLFRAIITGLVVVALWLAQGDAQDPLKQPGQPGPGQPGPADPDELATLVYPNHQARDRLDSALAALERGDLKNAVTNLGELFEHQADPSDPRRGALLVKDDGRVYRDARAIARRAVAERADGEKFVAEFRKQFDGVARRQLVAAMATMDLGALAELAARYPLCSCYDDVLRALADIAFDRGNFPMAARVRGVVLQREIEAGTVVPPEQRATDLARWALCAYIAQDDETTTRVLRRLRNDYAAVAFRLGPRDWTGATFDPADREAFRTDGLRESRRFSARVTAVTPMLADETAGLPDDYGQPLWSNRLPQPKVDAGGGVAPVDGVDPLPQRHRPAIAVGRVVVLPDPDRVIALDVITGAQAWDRNRYIGTKPLLEHSDMSDLFDETGKLGLARYDEGYDEVLVEGGRVLMQMQYPWVVRTEGGPGGRPTERLGRTTVLAALDSANGGIRWIQGRFRNGDTRSDGIRSVRRVPTAHNGRLYLPVSSGGGLYLACLDPLDGRVHWMTYLHFDPVGAAENNGPVGQPWIDPRQPRPAGASWSNRVLPVTFDGDMAYIVSTAGGVSAVDIVTGEVEWVSEYAPEYAQQLSGGQAGSRESWNCPPVVIDGRLVFAVRSPTGQSILRILDTRTGRVVASATGLTDVLGVVRIGPEVRIITRIGDDDVAAFSLLARRVWEARIPGGSGSGTIVDGSLLLWPCGNRLALIDIGDGSQLPAPQIRPDPTIPLGDLSMTGGLLVARHSEGVQAFLDVKRSEPFVKATMESDPSGPAGYLLQSTRLQLLGDMNGAVAAILDAQAHVRSAAAGQAVLERWVRLLDDRARAKIVVPDDELELLQAFAKKYANELMALTLPVRVFLQAKQYEQAAASCMQLLTARSGSPVRLDDRREVRSAALVATYIPDWRQQGGEEFAAALASALDARLQTMAAADADGIQRTRLLALTDDWPGAVARRLQLADAAVTAGSWTAAFVQGLAVFRHARAGDDEGKRGAMIVLRAADELHRADELVQAAQYLRAHSGDDPAVAELLAGHAAGLVDAWTSSAVELASARAFDSVRTNDDFPVAVRGPHPAAITRLLINEQRTVLRWTDASTANELPLGVDEPRKMGRPSPPTAAFVPASGIHPAVLVLDTGAVVIGVDLANKSVLWRRPWVGVTFSRPRSRWAGATGRVAGIDDPWNALLVVGRVAVIADQPEARERKISLIGLDVTTGEPVWTHNTDASASNSTLLLPADEAGAVIVRETVARRVSSFDGATGRRLGTYEWRGSAKLVDVRGDGVIVLGAAPQNSPKVTQLIVLDSQPAFAASAEEPALRWQVDSTDEITLLQTAGDLVVTQEGDALRVRRMSDGSAVVDSRDMEMLFATPLPGGRIVVGGRTGEGQQQQTLRVLVIDAAAQDPIVSSWSVKPQRDSDMSIIVADAQRVTVGGAPWLCIGIARANRGRSIGRGAAVTVDAVLIDPLARSPQPVRESVRLAAPAYAALWTAGLQMQIDGRDLVIALDGATDHRRFPLRSE